MQVQSLKPLINSLHKGNITCLSLSTLPRNYDSIGTCILARHLDIVIKPNTGNLVMKTSGK